MLNSSDGLKIITSLISEAIQIQLQFSEKALAAQAYRVPSHVTTFQRQNSFRNYCHLRIFCSDILYDITVYNFNLKDLLLIIHWKY
jgi:hypothetical protein